MKVMLKRFHLNVNTIGFPLCVKKLELSFNTQITWITSQLVQVIIWTKSVTTYSHVHGKVGSSITVWLYLLKYIDVYLSPVLFYVGSILGPYVHIVICIKFGVRSLTSAFLQGFLYDLFKICQTGASLIVYFLFLFVGTHCCWKTRWSS